MSRERRYRLLLRCYPRAYRAARGEELLDVLLAGSRSTRGRGLASEAADAASVVRHGLALRLRPSAPPAPRLGARSLLAACLVAILAVLGAHQLLAMGLRATGADGWPDAWGLDVLWVDPRWPVQAAWVLAGLALLLGRRRLTTGATWAGVLLQTWFLLTSVVTGAALPWPGAVGPHWVAPFTPTEATWLVAGLGAAVLLGSRTPLALRPRRWWLAVAVAVVGAEIVGYASYAALGTGRIGLVDDLHGPLLPLAVTTAALTLGLLRSFAARRDDGQCTWSRQSSGTRPGGPGTVPSGP